MDVLSDILQLIRLEGTVYFQSDFSAPWGMTMPGSPVAQFHMVVRGQCWLYTDSLSEPMPLVGGDVVVFPHGDAHWLANSPDETRMSGRAVLQAYQNGRPLFQNSTVCTTLVCGHFGFDRELHHPLLQALPPFIHLKGSEQHADSRLDTAVSLIICETRNPQPGSAVITDRLAEVLFIQIVRTFMAQSQSGGFLQALRDKEIGKALQIIHAQPEAPLTLAGIAQEIGMSRSTFAGRFKTIVGMTPMRYITGWRMQKARELLRDTNQPLTAVALQVGYQSQAAFIRAFQREFKQNPSAVR